LLSPTSSERGILFGDPSSIVNGGIVFNNPATPDGLQFRTGGNVNRMYLKSDGRLGLGTSTTLGQLTIADGGAPFGIDVQSSFSTLPTVLATNTGGGPAIWANGANATLPTIDATNTGGGPAIWANGTDDTALSGGGLIVSGPESGHNISIDNNEIMARNNGQTSTLHLNAEGGAVSFGPNSIKPPIAYGLVHANGNIAYATPNITSIAHPDDGRYQIFIEGGVTGADMIFVTSSGGVVNSLVATADNLYGVLIQHLLTGEDIDRAFQFIVYRP
jgi:hypothetical protein